MSGYFPYRNHDDPQVPDGYEQWLSARLSGDDGTPPVPPRLREAVLASQRGKPEPSRIRRRHRALAWGFTAVVAVLLSFASKGRLPVFTFTPVEAGIERIGSAIVTREQFDTEGHLERPSTVYYYDRKYRIEDENRITIASPGRFWDLDRKRLVYREELRPNDASRFRDLFRLPEIKQLNGDPVVPRDDPSTPDPNDVILQGYDSFGTRMTLRIDRETRLVQDWSAEVNTPKGWLRILSGRIRYGTAIDPKLFVPQPPPGSRPAISAEEQRQIRSRMEREAVRRTLAGRPLVVRDVFRNSQGDLFLLVSADPKFQKGMLELHWQGEGSVGLATTLHSFEADVPFESEGPHALRFPEGSTIVDWRAAVPGKVRENVSLQLRADYVEMTEPGAPPVNESTVIDIGEVPRSSELFPDWMDMAAEPLTPDVYWAHRAIALVSKGRKPEAAYNLKAVDEALARLPKPIGIPASGLFLARAKTLALLSRKQEALESLNRAAHALPYDKNFLGEVQKARESLSNGE